MLSIMPTVEKKRYLTANRTVTPVEMAAAQEDLLQWQRATARIDEKLLQGNGKSSRSSALLDLETAKSDAGSDSGALIPSHLRLLNKAQLAKIKDTKTAIKFDKLSEFQRNHRSGKSVSPSIRQCILRPLRFSHRYTTITLSDFFPLPPQSSSGGKATSTSSPSTTTTRSNTTQTPSP